MSVNDPMTGHAELSAWELAQTHERGYWGGALSGTNLGSFLKTLDYSHQQDFIYPLACWVGINKPGAVVLDVGCGPCGLAPWVRGAKRYGIEPLCRWFAGLGIDYAHLGYEAVAEGRGEDIAATCVTMGLDPSRPDLVLCANVLDHVPEPETLLAAIGDLGHKGSDLFLAYDVRFRATDLHPGLTPVESIAGVLIPKGWRLTAYKWNAPAVEMDKLYGRRLECWHRHSDAPPPAPPVVVEAAEPPDPIEEPPLELPDEPSATS